MEEGGKSKMACAEVMTGDGARGRPGQPRGGGTDLGEDIRALGNDN